MISSRLVLIAAVLGAVYGDVHRKRFGPPPPGEPDPRAKAAVWGSITQLVDHFNPIDERTWTMRFMENNQFFVAGGPMFVFLGGEWTIGPGDLQAGQMFDMAATHSGYMFYTEHRYYGQSYPTPDTSSANLQFLSADQALADLAYFIETKKAEIAGLATSKVVVVGASYSASLATWARIKYPHLVDIAYSSSGPLKAVVDFFEYYEVINDNLALASQQCVTTIAEGIAEVEAQLALPAGINAIGVLFNTCAPINTAEPHRSFFFNSIGEVFAGLVQYAAVGELSTACSQLLGYNGTSSEKLAAYVRNSYGIDCVDSYDGFIQHYTNTTLTTDAYRQWLYQTCTEYGYYQTTTSLNQPFGQTFPLSLYTQMCVDLFGVQFTSAVLDTAITRTNTFYGSLGPVATNLVSVHGTGDPWHALGLTHDLNPQAPVIVVNGTSHCADLTSVSVNDIPDMQAAKTRVKTLIGDWLLL